MDILVAYATKHGSTAGIAERIAQTLRTLGHTAKAHDVRELTSIDDYDAVVLGGAAYMFHWLKDAVRFARRHGAALRERPVWLFSSGPLGTQTVDGEGHDVIEASRPKEFGDLVERLGARGERVFFGSWDADAPAIGVAERMMALLPGSPALPAGDFRDWDAIDGWAAEIAAALEAVASTPFELSSVAAHEQTGGGS